MPETSGVSALAAEVTEAVLNAVQRNEQIAGFLERDDAVVVVRPLITMGGLIALTRGGVRDLAQFEAFQQQ